MYLEPGARMGEGVSPVRADYEVGQKIAFAGGSSHAHARDAIVVEEQVDYFMLHKQGKRGELFGFGGEEIEKVPLRHEADHFAVSWQARKIREGRNVAVKHSFQLSHLLVGQLKKFVEEPELIHEIERGR